MFKETHPVLGTRDIRRAIAFYTQRLGFKLAFGDKADPPNYVGFRRDSVELHMQFQFEHEMGTIRLRFLVDDPDALFNEYRQRGVECNRNSVHETPHMLRHSTGYKLVNDGHDTRSLAHYLGHRNLQSTARYTALAPDRFVKFWTKQAARGGGDGCGRAQMLAHSHFRDRNG